MNQKARWVKKSSEGFICELCPHLCNLSKVEFGICRTRGLIDITPIALSYGRISAMHIDPIEKKPLYHFYPGSRILSISTYGCNLRCLNCQNYTLSQIGYENKVENYIAPEDIIAKCLESECRFIAFTYGEPVVYFEYMLETSRIAKKNGIKTVMVSSGYINPRPLDELCEVLDAANIDLKSFDEKVYKKLNRATLHPVLKTLEVLRKKGIWLEITNLVIPGWTDDLHTIQRMCTWLVENGFSDYPLHFSRFFPTYKLKEVSATPVSVLFEAARIAAEAGMKYVYIGNLAQSNLNNTFCPECNSALIRRSGYAVEFENLSKGRCKNCGKTISGYFC